MALTTPVAFFLFNRPGVTRRVFEVIRAAKPERLLVVADGPRDGKAGERELCLQAQKVVLEGIDWPCQLETNISQANMGCGRRVSSGISWVFTLAEEAIILEDDCLPDESFFGFCQEMLEYYRDDERVMHISAVNLQKTYVRSSESYYYSIYPHIWGWATWRRAWRHYDFKMSTWPAFRDRKLLRDLFWTREEFEYWEKVLDGVHLGKIDTWDYQWCYTLWTRGGLAITPTKNLVSNLGFGPDATHTKSISGYSGMPSEVIHGIVHPPPFLIPSRQLDKQTFFPKQKSIPYKIWQRLVGAAQKLRGSRS